MSLKYEVGTHNVRASAQFLASQWKGPVCTKSSASSLGRLPARDHVHNAKSAAVFRMRGSAKCGFAKASDK